MSNKKRLFNESSVFYRFLAFGCSEYYFSEKLKTENEKLQCKAKNDF